MKVRNAKYKWINPLQQQQQQATAHNFAAGNI